MEESEIASSFFGLWPWRLEASRPCIAASPRTFFWLAAGPIAKSYA
jgi:hypothetical protein